MTLAVNKEKNKCISFKKIFLLFVIFSFIGCLYEELVTMIIRLFRDGNLNFITKRGLLYFELAPIYGFGATLMIFLLTRREHKKHEYFWLGALIGGTYEYLASYIQEIFTGTSSWNYSSHFLNINGRTSIPFMIVWGLLCYILMTKLYPYLDVWIDNLFITYGNTWYYIIFIIITLDIILSFSACIRMGFRHKGYEPTTVYGEFLDRVYDDDRMKKSYTTMKDK